MRLAALIQKTRYGAEAMDPKTIFRMATIEGARALHLNETGSIEKGKYADFVVLNENILDCSEQELLKLQVIYTFINGEPVYKKNN